MTTEDKIRQHVGNIVVRTKKVKEEIDRNFYADLLKDGKLKDPQSFERFFEQVKVVVDGQELIAYRGFLEAGLKAVKHHAAVGYMMNSTPSWHL